VYAVPRADTGTGFGARRSCGKTRNDGGPVGGEGRDRVKERPSAAVWRGSVACASWAGSIGQRKWEQAPVERSLRRRRGGHLGENGDVTRRANRCRRLRLDCESERRGEVRRAEYEAASKGDGKRGVEKASCLQGSRGSLARQSAGTLLGELAALHDKGISGGGGESPSARELPRGPLRAHKRSTRSAQGWQFVNPTRVR